MEPVDFATTRLNAEPDAIAPDGSEVRLVGMIPRVSMASFTLPPGACSIAVTHRTVEEIWYVASGTGEMWRRQGGREEVVALEPGMGLTIPLGTDFQFRAGPDEPFVAIGATVPSWPGEDEAVPVEGHWPASV